MICDDPMFGEKKWEAAESAMQKEAAVLAIGKAGLTPVSYTHLDVYKRQNNKEMYNKFQKF